MTMMMEDEGTLQAVKDTVWGREFLLQEFLVRGSGVVRLLCKLLLSYFLFFKLILTLFFLLGSLLLSFKMEF